MGPNIKLPAKQFKNDTARGLLNRGLSPKNLGYTLSAYHTQNKAKTVLHTNTPSSGRVTRRESVIRALVTPLKRNKTKIPNTDMPTFVFHWVRNVVVGAVLAVGAVVDVTAGVEAALGTGVEVQAGAGAKAELSPKVEAEGCDTTVFAVLFRATLFWETPCVNTGLPH